jgi:hypothetical protein
MKGRHLMQLLNGKIINRSSVELFVIETTTFKGVAGKPPALVHRLAPGMKSPKDIDADGFKRVDGKAIEGHLFWWKIRDFNIAEISGNGDGLTVSAIFRTAVKDDKFGTYETDNSPNWGEPIRDVAMILKDKKRRTIGYLLENGTELEVREAVDLASQGELDNVTVMTARSGYRFLRSKPDSTTDNNLPVQIVKAEA